MNLYCEFDVDGQSVVDIFESVPRRDQYGKIFPKAKHVAMVRFWRGEADAGQIRPQIAKWPIVSHTCGIHPSQVAEARAKNPRHIYNDQGQMVFTNAAHKRRCLRDIGMVDKLAYC